ncbi:hypothetical protein PanWU01x14_277300 [Parasponia andersonii]|uniref:Uncharacterized protein n=1 Tax=Parasponia andersonii TaxID=3476 RepID=A0A2P5B2P3_PARAD|nr:hypothetical protein PanWU01x14_277300 [Parasponia andersonii]
MKNLSFLVLKESLWAAKLQKESVGSGSAMGGKGGVLAVLKMKLKEATRTVRESETGKVYGV